MARIYGYAHCALVLGLSGWFGALGCSQDCERTRSCAPSNEPEDTDQGASSMGGGGAPSRDAGDGGDPSRDAGDEDESDDQASGGSPGSGGERDASGGADDGKSEGTPGDGVGGSDDDSEPHCASHEVLCGASCVDPLTDTEFCGATGTCTEMESGEACTEGTRCEQGSCVPVCVSDQVACAGACIDPLTDETFCGAANECSGRPDAGRSCTPGELCIAGSCHGWQGVERVSAFGTGEPNWLGLQTDQSGQTVLAYVQTVEKGEQEVDGLYTSATSSTGQWSTPTELYTSSSPITFAHLDRTRSGRGLLSAFESIYSPVCELDESGQPTENWGHVHYAGSVASHVGVIIDSGVAVTAWSGHDGAMAALPDQTALAEFEVLNAEDATVGLLDAAALSDTQVVLVWQEGESGAQSLRHAKYSTAGWAHFEEPITPSKVDAQSPVLVTNRKGGMYLTWLEGGAAGAQRHHVARYDVANERFADISEVHPHLSMAQGVEALVLDNGDLVTFSLLADSLAVARYSSSSGNWSEQVAPALSGAGPVTELQAGQDGAGNLFLSYLQMSSTSSTVVWWTTRYEVSTASWSEPFDLGVTDPHHRQLQVTPAGEALVAWTEHGEVRPYVRRFR